jgi:CheY-like chemotaxis protein
MSDKLRAVIRAYCATLAEQLAELERAAHDPDGPEAPARRRDLYEMAHRMAGAAQIMGFDGLGAAVGELEERARALLGAPDEQAQSPDVSRLVGRVREVCAAVRPEASSLWTGAPAGEVGESRDYAEPLLAGATVLAADDDRFVLQLVRTALIDAGAKRVILAADGADALRLCYPVQPSVVIADWLMKPASGLALLSAIRSGKTHMRADTPLILLTGVKERDAVRRAVEAGVDYFVVKPFTREALLRAVRIARHRYVAARAGFEDQAARLRRPSAST